MCIVGGDFNTDLANVKCATSAHLKEIFTESQLHIFNCVTQNSVTFVNEALNHNSTLDYFVLSDTSMVIDYSVIYPDINYSDHLRVSLVCRIDVACYTVISNNDIEVHEQSPIDYLRWDQADLLSCHCITGQRLQLVLDQMHEFDQL